MVDIGYKLLSHPSLNRKFFFEKGKNKNTLLHNRLIGKTTTL